MGYPKQSGSKPTENQDLEKAMGLLNSAIGALADQEKKVKEQEKSVKEAIGALNKTDLVLFNLTKEVAELQFKKDLEEDAKVLDFFKEKQKQKELLWALTLQTRCSRQSHLPYNYMYMHFLFPLPIKVEPVFHLVF